MPWEIRRGTSQCSGYGVFKEGTNELEGCHTSREAAQRQMAALYASEPEAAQKDVITNETTPNLYPQYIGPKKKRRRQMIDTTKSMHMEDELYDMLTPEEKAFHDALVGIAEQYGPFDQGTSSIWVGYETPDENEDAAIGVKCGNCSFHYEAEDGGLGCKILSYKVQENAKCRLAAIPDGLVNPQNAMPTMNRDEQQEFVDDMMERIGKSMNEDLKEAMEILKSLEKGYKNKEKSMDEDEDDWYKRDYSAEQRRQMASRGQAMPDGSFPIANRTDLGNAIQSVGRASNYDAARRHIISRARALGAVDMLPEDWNVSKSVESDSAQQTEVPADLSSIFANMPKNARRVNTTGNASVNFPLFRESNG